MTDRAEWERKMLKISTIATLDEIVAREKAFKEQHGIDIYDALERQLMAEMVARIEAKTGGKGKPEPEFPE